MINIFNLNQSRDEKEVKKIEIYRKVLDKVHFKIQENSKRNISFCFYTIPNFILGLPAYDHLSCADYIVDKLRKNGFIVLYTHPNLLYVSWNHVPSSIKYPSIRQLELNMITNPNTDYSKLVYGYNYQPQPPALTYFDSTSEITSKNNKYNDTDSNSNYNRNLTYMK
jgi:hypothetical protein